MVESAGSGDAGQRGLQEGLQGCSAALDRTRLAHRLHYVWPPGLGHGSRRPPAARPARNGTRKHYLTSVDIGLFTGPHQTSFLDDSSSTIRLSDGERPVLAPEYAESAPVDVMAEPDS